VNVPSCTYFPSPCFGAEVPNPQSIERKAMLLPIPIYPASPTTNRVRYLCDR